MLGHFNTGRSSMKSRVLNTVGGNVYRIVNARIRHMMTSPKDLFKLAVYGFSDFANSITYFCDFTTSDGFEIVELRISPCIASAGGFLPKLIIG